MNRPIWVTACIPTFRCNDHLPEAVLSLLGQTYPFVRVIVINDGDPEPPWAAISNISDPRLVRFDLTQNRGPYFALAVATEATPDPLFLVQDADDVSAPNRIEVLLRLLCEEGSAYAFSAVTPFYRDDKLGVIPSTALFSERLAPLVDAAFYYRLPHHGLFRTAIIRELGGYFGGFRFGYDKLLTNFLLMAASVSWTPQCLYWMRSRAQSLTRAQETGLASRWRYSLNAEMELLYAQAFSDYLRFAVGAISQQRLRDLIRWRVQWRCGPADRKGIHRYAAHLRQVIHAQCQPHPRHDLSSLAKQPNGCHRPRIPVS